MATMWGDDPWPAVDSSCDYPVATGTKRVADAAPPAAPVTRQAEKEFSVYGSMVSAVWALGAALLTIVSAAVWLLWAA